MTKLTGRKKVIFRGCANEKIGYSLNIEGNEAPINQNKKMQYSQSATAPDWFQSDDSKIYASATSGSSPFNEWYEFDNRADALDHIAKAFDSQSFVDGFCWFGGEIYDYDQFTPESMETADDIDGYILKDGAEVADLGEMVEAESRF